MNDVGHQHFIASEGGGIDGGSMVIKSYKNVVPTGYQGVPEGVQIREMITSNDGAPTFAMRVLDVQHGASTPTTRMLGSTRSTLFQEQDECGRKEKRRRSSQAIQSTSPRTSSIASLRTRPRRCRWSAAFHRKISAGC